MITDLFFFFFQAEDGIRDGHVTGVQTCALPIFVVRDQAPCSGPRERRLPVGGVQGADEYVVDEGETQREGEDLERRRGLIRSEERRVGKKWRARWAPDQ